MTDRCDNCSGELCPTDFACAACGTECDADRARGFVIKRALVRGDTKEIEYDLLDKNGAAIDLGAPGVSVWFTLKYYLSDPDATAIVQQTLANGGIVLRDTAGSGHVRVLVPASATQGITEGTTKLYYDVQLLDGNGRITTVERGLFMVDPDVTRAIVGPVVPVATAPYAWIPVSYDPLAATRAEWHINANTGLDSNVGDLATRPLRTWGEFRRRVGPQKLLPPFDATYLAHPLRIYIESDLPTTDPIEGEFWLGEDVAIHVHGTAKTTNATGTITAVTAKNPATNQPFQITDSGLAGGWAAHVGRRMRITSGPRANTIMWVAKNLGGGAAWVSDPSRPDQITNPDFDFWMLAWGLTPLTPQVNDPYAIETLPTVSAGALMFRGMGAGQYQQQLQLVFGELSIRGEFSPEASVGALVSTWACKMSLVTSPGGTSFFGINSLAELGYVLSEGLQNILLGGLCGHASSTVETFGLLANAPTYLGFDTMFYMAGIKGRSVHIQSAAVFDCTDRTQWRGGHAVQVGSLTLDQPAGSDIGPPGGMVMGPIWNPAAAGDSTNGRLWGSGNAGAGVSVSAGSSFSYKAGNAPTITGAGGDFRLAGAATARAWDEAGGAITSARACTWANLAATIAGGGFGGSAHNWDRRASIVTNS